MPSVKEPPQDGASARAGGEARGSTSAKSALKAAAVAAATTAGAAAARKAFSKSNGGGDGKSGSRFSGDTLSSGAQAAWEAAREHVLPAMQDASRALGRYLARDAPEILRDVLVPPLVSAFEEARTAAAKEPDEESAAGGAT
jgi:hypothetical protein